jgi:hypothetical protein
MLRVLPLLVFAALPALLPSSVAAPVPPGGRVEFGPGGLLTRGELEKVKFDSCPLEPGEKVGDLPAEKEPAEERKSEKPRPKNRYDVAVHMPWKRFGEGDSIPAYYVLRNNRGYPLSLDARLSLFGSEPTLWNSCSIDVRDAKTGKSVYIISRGGWSCGGGGLVDVPADGFYCVKGELGRTASDQPLSPGEYEVDWRYGSLRSAPVAFTVLKTSGKIPPATKRPDFRFYKLNPARADDDEDSPASKGDSRLEPIHAEEIASALAVGENVLVPDLHTIPASDKLVEAWLEWKPYRDGDRLVVTLRARPPHKQVSFDEMPHLHLQMEVPGDGHSIPRAKEEKQLARLKHAQIVTPLTIEVKLPAGPVRVAVLVSAKEIELPRGRNLRDKLIEAVRKPDPDDPPMWQGIVRTEYVELRLPPRLPKPEQP